MRTVAVLALALAALAVAAQAASVSERLERAGVLRAPKVAVAGGVKAAEEEPSSSGQRCQRWNTKMVTDGDKQKAKVNPKFGSGPTGRAEGSSDEASMHKGSGEVKFCTGWGFGKDAAPHPEGWKEATPPRDVVPKSPPL